MGPSAALEAEGSSSDGSGENARGTSDSAEPHRFSFASVSPTAWLLLIGCFWFVTCLSTVLWTWGLDPLVFPSSDEAVVRYAARLIEKG